MKTQTIEYDDGEIKARIVVSAANTLQGNKRARLTYELEQYDKANTKENDVLDPDKRVVHGTSYPACLASAKHIEINGHEGDPDIDTFDALPDALTVQWINYAYELNPHWLGSGDDEKKGNN